VADTLQLVSFLLEKRLYGVDIRVVKEVNPTAEITPVPRTPEHIRGLVNVRGQVVLVMDIAAIFGRECRPITPESQVVILKTARELAGVGGLPDDVDIAHFGDKPLGFLIDEVRDVVTVPSGEVNPPPQHLEEDKSKFHGGVVRLGDKLLVILRVGEMF